MSILSRLTGSDPARVREEMIALKEPERRKRAKAAGRDFDRFGWNRRDGGSKRWRAAALAWVGTATARKIVADFWRVGFELDEDPALADDVYAVLSARGRAFFETLARGLLRTERAWGSWPLVRRAVREGLIEPPEGDEYILGLVFGLSSARSSIQELDAVYKGLLADPHLLEREVWQLFEIDAGSELGNANTWEQQESEVFSTRGDNHWLYGLARLADEGRLDRQRLLDASLDALMRDFRASTIGWYVKLHEDLKPTREERLDRLDRYLGLVTSPAPPVVKEGLAALRDVEDAVPAPAFARVAPTPFTQRQKNLSSETLSMLTRLCKRDADARAELLEAAAHALAHERADVQERALKLLEQYPDEVPRASLLEYVAVVSPALRPRIEALTGLVTPQEETAEIEIREPVQPTPAREGSAELVPVESVDELIELAAMLLEGQGDGDDCERFLDGVSRLCDQRPSGFERRAAGLLKRVGATSMWGAQASGTELVGHVVEAWAQRRPPRMPLTRFRTIFGFLAGRAEEVAKRATRGDARPLLAFPTHSGGWIDPVVLDTRGQRADPLDRMQAEVRASRTIGPLGYERRMVGRRLVLAAPGAPAALSRWEPLAAAVATVQDTTERWYGVTGWAGLDALGVRWALTVLPSLPEVGFAGAAIAAVDSREGSAYHHPEVVLEHALDPGVPLRPEAWLAAAGCLVAKSPGLPRVAVDLLVASIEDGRFDATALGSEIAWLVDNDFAKMNRLEAPLRDAARVSPLHAAQVVRIVEAVLAQLTTKPRALYALLEVAVETGRPIGDERTRAALTRIAADASRSSKLGKLARALLES